MTDDSQIDERLCDSEFPGDDMFVGQLCEREHGHDGDHEHLAMIAGTRHTRRLVWPAVATVDRPFANEPTEVLRTALNLASTHASQAARFALARPDDQLPAVADLFRTELQHRGEL